MVSARSSLFVRITSSQLSRLMAKTTSRAVNLVAPDWTCARIENQLLKQNRGRQQVKLPHGIETYDIDSRHGRIQAYRLGRGPTVVLVHGWASMGRLFFPLMRGLAQCGFSAISFDHIGHGQSEGEQASLQSFIHATNRVLRHSLNNAAAGLAAIVAHGMGCISVANSDRDILRDTPLLLIAPVFDLREYLANQVRLPSLNPGMIESCLSRLAAKERIDFDDVSLMRKLPDYAATTTIVHDRSDEVTSFVGSVKFLGRNTNCHLHVTDHLGHERIIHSETVWLQLKSLLNYEDITTFSV